MGVVGLRTYENKICVDTKNRQRMWHGRTRQIIVAGIAQTALLVKYA